MAIKETIEAVVRKLQQGKYPNEQSISIGIVMPILSELGWETTDPDCVWPEYSVKNGRVDFALCYPLQHPKVFVEVKQPGKADGADEQLFDYALRHGVRMALLTDGRTWSFYLPGEEGSYEDRRVYKLDLLERTSDASAESLNRYLAQARIANGQAIDDAVREIRDRSRTTLATKTIPAAWQSLVDDADPTITERLADEVEAKCGVRPEIDAVAKFLKQLGRGSSVAGLPAPVTNPRPTPQIAPTPMNGPHRLGYSYRGGWRNCHSGKEVMLGLLREFAHANSSFCDRCYQDEDNRGRSRIYITRDRYEIYRKDQAFCEKHSVELVPGWFIATNLSDDAMDKIIRMACRIVGATIDVDVSYSLD
jgi:hypothetical protein